MTSPGVYLDANVFKFAASELRRFVPEETHLTWGSHEITVDVHRLEQIDPNDSIKSPSLKDEAFLLKRVAELAVLGRIRCYVQVETQLEVWGLPNMDSESGLFYGAEIHEVDAPIQYDRVIAVAFRDSHEIQFDFLCSIDHPRFLELQRVTGAFQGLRPPNRNQLLDAWHLWCAEGCAATHFLTLDSKLARLCAGHRSRPRVRVVLPAQLLGELDAA